MPAEVAVVVAVVVEIVVVPGHPLERELCRRNWIELPAEKRVINIPNRIIGEGKVLMPGVSVENASSTVQQYFCLTSVQYFCLTSRSDLKFFLAIASIASHCIDSKFPNPL